MSISVHLRAQPLQSVVAQGAGERPTEKWEQSQHVADGCSNRPARLCVTVVHAVLNSQL